MSIRKMQAKYNTRNTKQAINAAIRAEMVGGDDLLNALSLVHRLATRLKSHDVAGQDEAWEALDALTRLRDLMVNLVLKKYQ